MSSAWPGLSDRPADAAAGAPSPTVTLPGGACRPAEAGGVAARRAPKGQPMLKSFTFLQNFLGASLRRDDRGATAVEYGLIVTLIAVAIIAIVGAVGGRLVTEFTNVFNAL
jgi:pilus assembly protein Flp/PilA